MEKPEAVYEAPLRLYETEVHPEWVDYNGHMSEAFYALVFSFTTDAFIDLIGIDSDYRESSGTSLYTLEIHISYLQEVREGAPLTTTTQLLDLDHKRAHLFHAMYHGEDGRLFATEEVMMLNVNTAEAQSTPFADEVASRLRRISEAHNDLPTPDQAGRSIAIRR